VDERQCALGSERSRIEHFAVLDAIRAIRHGFIERIPDIDVSHEKGEVLKRLEIVHREARRELGMADWPLLTAQQVHGNKIAVVDHPLSSEKEFAGCDGLITNQKKIALGVHVADCCAVYIVDPKTPAVGLVHSGKKGTELAIASKAIQRLRERFGSDPAELIVQLSPCIRPPHYEVDFATRIIEQCRAQGVDQIHDCGICTACHLDLYYSYRAEKGRTGRMLALLGINPEL
jgi:copper oxidase (laccase) domain-containing protein